MRDRVTGQKSPLWKKALLGLLAIAVTLAVVAGIVALNWREDRERPMYHDVILMAALQHELLENDQAGLELTIDDESEPVVVGDASFAPQPGVEIVVEQRGESFCVRGSNEYGDETRWLCVDGTGDPPDLGVLEKEF